MGRATLHSVKDELYSLGHKDMIDNILYVHAARLNLVLYTEDEKLMKFILEKKLKDEFCPE